MEDPSHKKEASPYDFIAITWVGSTNTFSHPSHPLHRTSSIPTVISPVEKLPLAVCKNVRDGFESKRADLEKELSDLLGVAWIIEVNPNAIWVYFGALWKLKYFLNDNGHGREGKDEINTLCPNHVLTMEMDEEGKVRYCGCDVRDRYLRILFQDTCLGSNIDYALTDLEDALSAVSPAGYLSYSVCHSIKQDWDKDFSELKAKIAKQLANAIVLDPNWEQVHAALEAEPCVKEDREGWEKRFGSFVKSCFEALAYTLAYNEFETDNLLREGFEEAVSKNEIRFRIVKELTGGAYYNQTVIEDGVLYLQTVPQSWGVNVDQVASKIADVL
ncbi:hypothetical protein BCR34DRAFT_632056 [Clohesyomyces aquaticus]|uniref:Uncharacterized protein n=1 Tax=Clohesyomyces aquaticus TaxID=1231657 RepID=A0A1Y1Z9I8_9PLEO|nr:hypothetical protein BCR34DRAFT_632056 [Clohesyomyces aquaticus]